MTSHHHHTSDVVGDLEEFRRAKDEFFARDPRSPLPHAERRTFEGLSYFPHDPQLTFDTQLEPADGDILTIPTSDGEDRRYRRSARVTLRIDGQPISLVLLEAEGESGYFLPFRDATSGTETYGAGRYLDVDVEGGRAHVDLNRAYNPFCAYDDAYSCPLPPPENWLKVPIRAGEKYYRASSG